MDAGCSSSKLLTDVNEDGSGTLGEAAQLVGRVRARYVSQDVWSVEIAFKC